MVNLTRIYTRTGDDGETRLGDISRTAKNDPRLHAYADVDEANAHIGVALTLGDLSRRRRGRAHDRCRTTCSTSAPTSARRSSRTRRTHRCASRSCTSTGSRPACDDLNEHLPKLRSFILNGGSPGAAHLHVARTVARRAERSAWAASSSTRTR